MLRCCLEFNRDPVVLAARWVGGGGGEDCVVGRLLQLLARAACYHSSALRDCFKKQNKQSGKSPPLAVPHKGVCTDADTHACVCRRSSSESDSILS